ncbi:MAG: NUDIX hydrolase [Bacteroidota bacterium]
MNWIKRTERLAYNGWRKILRKTFLLPNGKEEDFDVLHAGDYATIAAFTAQQEAILVYQYRPGPERILSSFVEGAIDAGETPEEAAKRELLEESGYQAKRILPLKQQPSSYTSQTQHCFLALDCEKVAAQQLDDNEFIEVRLMPLKAFERFVKDASETSFVNTASALLALDHLNNR